MTEKESSPTSSPSSPKLKTLLFQGAIGAVSLAGATAIPLIVQQFLSPTPAPVSPASPAQVTPAQVVPAQVTPAQATPAPDSQVAAEEEPRGHRDKEERRREKQEAREAKDD